MPYQKNRFQALVSPGNSGSIVNTKNYNYGTVRSPSCDNETQKQIRSKSTDCIGIFEADFSLLAHEN